MVRKKKNRIQVIFEGPLRFMSGEAPAFRSHSSLYGKSGESFPLVICILLIGIFFSLIIANMVNIPNGDDLYCLMLFTQQFKDASTFQERFALFTQQWVEHRIVYSRFSALLSYWLTGSVNFITIALIGNFTLIAFTVLFWKVIRKLGVSLYFLIPVVLTLFSPVTYEGNLWAGASTVYMPVAFMGLLAIYFLACKREWGIVLGLLTALLATFSFGNGMFVLVVGLGLLIYRKRFRRAVIWGLASLVAIGLYFMDFHQASSTDAFGVSAHFRKPMYLFYNFFAFLGGILDYSENVNSPFIPANIPAILLGATLFAAICYGSLVFLKEVSKPGEDTSRRNIQYAWLGMTAFLLITAVAMAYSRTAGAAMNTLSSRYKIYSMLFWIIVYWGCLIYFERKKLVGLVFGITSLLMLVFNYYTHYDKFSNFNSNFLAGLFNYKNNGEWVIYRHTAFYEGASKMLSDSMARNPDPVFTFHQVFPQLTRAALEEAPVLEQVEISESENCRGFTGKCLAVRTDEYPSIANYFEGIYLVVYDETNIYLFAARPQRNGRYNMVVNGEYFKSGFSLEENFGNILKKGSEYRLAVFCPTAKEQVRRIRYKLEG